MREINQLHCSLPVEGIGKSRTRVYADMLLRTGQNTEKLCAEVFIVEYSVSELHLEKL